MEYFILILISLTLYLISSKINTFFFNQSNNILINSFIYSFFFLIIYLIFSYLFILGINTKIISYTIVGLIILNSFIFKHELIGLVKKLKIKHIKDNKFLTFVLVLYFLIILFPAYEEDSLRYHLEIAKKINNNTFFLNPWLDYLFIGAHEFINAFSINLNFNEISSYSNFIFLLFAIFSNYYILKKYKVGSGILSGLAIISCPYFISLLASQKLYLMPCYIVSYSIAYLYLEKKNLEKKILYLILFINIFCVIIKPIFLPYLALIGLLSLIKIKNYSGKIYYCLMGVGFLAICYFPIYYIKLKIFNDPFLPYFSLNINNFEWFYEWKNYLSKIRMDYTDYVYNNFKLLILVPIKLVVPLQFSDLFKTLGFAFLFIFSINYKKNKKLIFIVLFFIISVIILQSYQSRWFLPLFFLILIFSDISKFKYIYKVIKIQTFGVTLILIPLASLTFLENFKLLDNKVILDKFLNSQQFIDKINKKYKNQKIFSSYNNFYLMNNPIPVYYPNITTKFDKNFYKKNESDTKLILWYGDRYGGVQAFVNKNFTCKKLKIIEKFKFNSRRFYSLKSNASIILYRFNC